ncbi:MAG: type II secretion system secretin GspD [Thermodesulfobacteriota bacterium]
MKTLTKITAHKGLRRSLFLLFLASLLIITSGCADRGQHDTSRTLDLKEISSRITKQEDNSSLLVQEEIPGEGASTPLSRNFRAEGQGNNPALDKLMTISKHLPGSWQEVLAQEQQALTPLDQESTDGLLLNFDNADIYEVIQVLGDALGLNYMIDPQVKGVVNIRSARKIASENLFPIFKKILHMNGLDIRNEGSHNYIYVARKPYGQQVNDSADIADLQPSSRLILQIVPIMHLAAQEATKLVESYLSEQGAISTIANQNTLLISDYESKIIDVLTILSRLDVSPLATLQIRLVKVENAPLFDLRDEVVEILNTLHVNNNNFEGIAIQPLERISSLLLVSRSDFLVKNAEKWIAELDVTPGQDRDNIYIYNARNTVASELAELVNNLIQEDNSVSSKSAEKRSSTTKKPTTNKIQKKTPLPKATASKGKGAHSSLRFAGTPLLLADDTRNIILIRALPPDYNRIVRLLERLDNLPRQVLVEVMVAEVTLTDDLSLGVEWAILNNKLGSHNGTPYTFSMDTFGLTSSLSTAINFVVQGGDSVKGLLKALASKTDLSILSSPQVLVLNNETATVNVGVEVPIVTTVTENNADAAKVDKTIQYKDTGVILEVTPQINYDGIIILDINQTVSKALPIQEEGVQSNPISTKELKTKFAVKNGQSILIGGLIDSDNSILNSGIPLLKDIPLLGYLFKFESRQLTKTELLIMLTPYVIETEDVLDQYINEFQGKMSELRQELHRNRPGPFTGITR